MSVFVQIWQLLFDDLCPDATAYFVASIDDRGVAGTISWLTTVSQMLINNEPGSVVDAEFLNILSQYPIKDQLQVLRFGKRFGTSDWSGEDEQRILSSFMSRNNRCKMLDRHELPTWLRLIMNGVKADLFSCAYETLNVGSFDELRPERCFEWDWKHFPHGTTAEGYRNEFEKWLSLSASYGLIDPMLAQGINHHDHGVEYTSTSNLCFVAKDYRGPRLIMEEDLEVTLRQTPVCEAMMRIINTHSKSVFCPADRVTLDDQTRNQELAIAGASSKYYATIDLSDASDCISTRLLFDALPTDVAAAITNSRSLFVNLTNGRTVPLYIPCTMGSRNTVPGQSLVYWVCAMTAVEIGVRYDLWSYDIVADISVYNDDIIVPSVMYDLVTTVLTKVGLVVNFDKSYTDDHPFRESCGVDAYEDLIVTTSYWPRKNVELSTEFLPSLCSLQNKLFTYPARRASDFVVECVLAIAANTPVRLPGEKTTCLYGNKSNYQVVPYATAVQGCDSAPDGVGLMSTYELRQTYDNRLVTCDSLIDGHFVTPQHVQQLAELYEYEYWLLYGSEWYDALCEHLHVSMPIKRRKHLVPRGYTARRAYSSIADPSALRAGQRESNLRQARQALFNARQAKKRRRERERDLKD
jgi:hypothetical protein